jgi:hypothetical protein
MGMDGDGRLSIRIPAPVVDRRLQRQQRASEILDNHTA